MVCLTCGSKTQISNSRWQKRNNHVWRRRHCLNCGSIFTTVEAAQYEAAWAVLNKKARLEPFSRDKLLLSLYKSCGHRKTALSDAAGLADTIIRRMSDQVSNGQIDTASIERVALIALNRFDKAAVVYYRAHHSPY
jgi:transcriptional regulator NrdR family protein